MNLEQAIPDARSHRPRVLLVSPVPPPEGGIASWTQRMLASDTLKQVPLYHLNSSLPGGHSRIGGALLPRVSRSAAFFPRFVWACLRSWPSVIHLTSGGFPGYYRDIVYIFFARLLRRKVLLNLRFGDVDAFTTGVPRLLRPFVRASLRSCWCVVPITQPMAEVMRQLDCRRIEVIPNCVDILSDSGEKRSRSQGGGVRVLYVGWVIPAKGIRELLRAVAQVEGANLTIIGPLVIGLAGDDGQWIDKSIGDLHLEGRVRLVGRVEPEMARQACREHDVLVLPSYQEGFPNVVLEAMEAGIPVIATNVGAIPEIIRDRTDGFLVDVGDVGELSDRLRWLKEHPQERVQMGRAARERVSKLYSVERVAGLWVDLYKRAASSG